MIETKITNNSSVFSPSTSVDGCPPDFLRTASVPRWYVLRATYSRELKAERLLQDEGIETFVPMRLQRTDGSELLRPAVHNLLFAHSTREILDPCKRKLEESCPLRYALDTCTRAPMFVRDADMEDFIRVTREHNDLFYLDDPAVAIRRGVPVRIVRGPYSGVRGYVLRILRDRRVVITLDGLVSVALNGIPMRDLEPISD